MTTAEQALQTESVQKARQALRQERERKSDLLQKYNEAKDSIENHKEELTEARADRQLEQATDEDVEEAKTALQTVKEEASELREEYQSSERAIEKIQDRLEYRRIQALERAKVSLKEEYLERLQAAQEAVADAQKKIDRAAEVGDELSDGRLDGVGHTDKAVPGDVTGGVELFLHNHVGAELGKALDRLSTGIGRTKSQIEVNRNRLEQ